ncbi:MAG: hypothetical protein KDD48_07780 [Bdellovibrionales bacterium]|nr:hypothetical protein [Bdellovibrionales bacterium]
MENKLNRISISHQAMEKLNEMMKQLKVENPYTRINSTKLSSWIIEYFFKSCFRKCKSKMIADHFQSKEYFKHMLSQLDEDLNPERTLKFLQSKLKDMNKPQSEGI